MAVTRAASTVEWEHLATEAFVPVVVDSRVDQFAGTMDHRVVGDADVTLVRSVPCDVARTSHLIAESRDDLALISLQLRGWNAVHQYGVTTRVTPGEGVLYLARDPYELTFPHASDLIVFQIAADSFGIPQARREQLAARTLPMTTDLSLRTYVRIIRSYFADRPIIDDAARMASVSAELLGAALRALIDTPAPPRSHDALFASFDRFIADHLDDPTLGVPALAEAERVSARTVHAVFADRSHTPAAYIRTQRLRRAERLLKTTHLRMPDIAALTGFNDSATLSRVFRRVEGRTPSEFRRDQTSER